MNKKNLIIYPRNKESWVGDPMPFFDGQSFEVFYLEDLRNRDKGFHPWSLLSTKNFFEYKNEGIVIPYVNDSQSQELALGTGSVIKDKEGTYHAFYTGHNENKTPKEAIMHAVSKDMKKWTKQPDDTFYGSNQYEKDDFRDPYVFYNQDYKQYWMLITTRKNNMGVIALYTSKDLKKWEDNGVFFSNDTGSDSNLECSSLIKYRGYWYLTFSDQWPNRVVHYRIASDSKGKFKKPRLDHFDGNGFYAGRMENDKKNLYLFGWVPTKIGYDDSQNYDWAGNLVVHQIKQKGNGELFPIVPESIDEEVQSNVKLKPITQSNAIWSSKNSFTFSGNRFGAVRFREIQGVKKITGSIATNDKNNQFGFVFDVGENGKAPLNIVFNSQRGQLEFYNVSTDKIGSVEPQSTMPFQVTKSENIDFKILTDDSVVVLYVNNKVAFSTRMFNMRKHQWGIFSVDSNVTFQDLKINN
ncbi:DUF4975 domain-containing protein [Bacillus sp. BRMEA1]|uniref:glycoside hydrolase family 32 protein n=1 Tax=Neobacillus endophyticus TaxID=2738405 RepID=UPI0015635888|nr:glycoside hydrolase family 32 protein [Neobacillus endophyticus]NRD80999.1 DUF4975 domain-containing protein [Neobacillus endophyticus]